MFRRICGALLFLWMASAAAVAIRDFDLKGGTIAATRALVIVVVILLALIGLLLALGKSKPPSGK